MSLTSRWMAANRALETERQERLFSDPFARALAGDEGFALQAQAEAYKAGPPSSEPDAYGSIRTRFFDDALLAFALQMPEVQVVLLAAGMDTRAYRLEWPAGVTVYEVDRQEVLEQKEPILAALEAHPRCARRIVMADLEEAWVPTLLAAGFEPRKPAAFLAEGLLVYLEEQAVSTLLTWLEGLAARGSWLGLDVVDTSLLQSPYMKPFLDRLDGLGCGWRFATPEPEQLLAQHGWSPTVTMPGEPGAHYDRWPYPVAPRNMPNMLWSYLVTGRREADDRTGPSAEAV